MPLRGAYTTLATCVLVVVCATGCAPDEARRDVHAQRASADPRLERADSIVAAWVEAGTVSGAVLSIARGGEPAFARAYGYARQLEYGEGEYRPNGSVSEPEGALTPVAAPVPMTEETVFDLASVTKVMATTFAIMALVDGGAPDGTALDLDAPVSDVLQDFGGGGKERVTPRHLLTHRSGLAQWQPTFYFANNPDEGYDFVRRLPLTWPVGQERHYSDLGFMVLGRVAEALSGQSLDQYVASAIYGPLGLGDTGFRPADGPFAATSHGNPFEYRMVHDTTFGYAVLTSANEPAPEQWDGWRRRTLEGEVNDGNAHHAFHGVAGHAGLFSTAQDLQTLMGVLLQRDTMLGGALIDRRVIEEFLTDTGENQALGWQVPDYAPPGSFTHTGFTGTWVLGVPAEDLSVVLLTNRQHGGVDYASQYPDLGPLQRAVAAALF